MGEEAAMAEGAGLPVDPAAADDPASSSERPALADPGDVSLLSLIDRLATLLDRSELTELEVQVGATGLVLRKPVAVAPPPVVVGGGGAAAHAGEAAEAAAPSAAGAAHAAPEARPSVKAPLTGIWYASPTPGSSPFVEAGGEVAAGQVIGLIEAMKLFNEIKSDLSGRVVKVHAENGKLVKAKQPLIEVEPL
jgi:acetyl-CoA carboxylase biotin carboxyl carrier protein